MTETVKLEVSEVEAAFISAVSERGEEAVLDGLNTSFQNLATTLELAESQNVTTILVNVKDVADALAVIAASSDHLTRLTGRPFDPMFPVRHSLNQGN